MVVVVVLLDEGMGFGSTPPSPCSPPSQLQGQKKKKGKPTSIPPLPKGGYLHIQDSTISKSQSTDPKKSIHPREPKKEEAHTCIVNCELGDLGIVS